MFLYVVPRLMVVLAPFTSRSLITTTASPSFRMLPLLSLVMTVHSSSSLNGAPGWREWCEWYVGKVQTGRRHAMATDLAGPTSRGAVARVLRSRALRRLAIACVATYACGALLPVCATGWWGTTSGTTIVLVGSEEQVYSWETAPGALLAGKPLPADSRVWVKGVGPDWRERLDEGPVSIKRAIADILARRSGPTWDAPWEIVAGGWPFYVVYGFFDVRGANPPRYGVAEGAVILDDSRSFERALVVPLRPMWQGLLANSLLLWLAMELTVRARQWLTRRSNRVNRRCENCGYALVKGAYRRCPECGEPKAAQESAAANDRRS